MARKLRVQYPGAIYHVMSRGDRREDIFQSDDDRRLFLETLGQACEKCNVARFSVDLVDNRSVLEAPWFVRCWVMGMGGMVARF